MSLGARPLEREPAAEGVAHGAQKIDLRRRARRGDAGAAPDLARRFLQRRADEIGKFEILEENVEDFVLRHREFEIVFAFAGIAGLFAAPAALAGARFLDLVARHEFLVAGQHEIVFAARLGIEPETRLLRALGGNLDLAFLADIGDGRILRAISARLREFARARAAESAAGWQGFCPWD